MTEVRGQHNRKEPPGAHETPSRGAGNCRSKAEIPAGNPGPFAPHARASAGLRDDAKTPPALDGVSTIDCRGAGNCRSKAEIPAGNPGPLAPQAARWPAYATAQKHRPNVFWTVFPRVVVGAPGIEPGTSCTPCKRASRTAPRPDLIWHYSPEARKLTTNEPQSPRVIMPA